MKATLYHGDCLTEMQKIPDSSVDAVITDLPYGTTACKWDVIIPFDRLWEQFGRVCKDTSPIVLFGSQPFTTMMIASNVKWFREELIWLKNKQASGMGCETRHMKVHEDVIVFSKKSGYIFNPIKWNVEDKKFLTHRRTMCEFECGNNVYGRKCVRKRHGDDGTRFPISIVAYKIPMTPAKTKTYSPETDIGLHPTQKPVALIEYLIRTYTNEGETVLDATMGSGTTGVACVNTNRNFIGIEKDAKYFEIAKSRIEKAQNTPKQEMLTI